MVSTPFHEGFDYAGLAVQPRGKPFAEAMRTNTLDGPSRDINPPALHIFEDAMMFGRGAVAARQDRHLAPVKFRVEEGNVVVDQADEDQFATLLEELDG